MTKIDNDGILEYLAAKINCPCLSDLHYLSNSQIALLKAEIQKIPVERYSHKEWKDALNYLTGSKAAPEDPEEIKMLLLEEAWAFIYDSKLIRQKEELIPEMNRTDKKQPQNCQNNEYNANTK